MKEAIVKLFICVGKIYLNSDTRGLSHNSLNKQVPLDFKLKKRNN